MRWVDGATFLFCWGPDDFDMMTGTWLVEWERGFEEGVAAILQATGSTSMR